MRFMTVFKCNILFSILIVLLISCKFDSIQDFDVHDEKEVNYLVYMAADNNLERFGIGNIKALQQGFLSSKNVNILVLFDRSPGYDKTEDNRTGTDLFYITPTSQRMNDDIIKEYGELDMTDSNNLYEFLCFANKYFPARHTVLNIWSHGQGVYPDGIISKGVIADYSSGYGASNTMAIVDMANAIKKFENESKKKIDIIQFDACDMQMIEVAYQLKNLTEYVVGSETEIPGSGSDYKSIAEYLTSATVFNSDSFASFLVDSFFKFQQNSNIEFSYAALKTSQLDAFISRFNELCQNADILLGIASNQIKNIRNGMICTDDSYPEFVDMKQILDMFNTLGLDLKDVNILYNNLVPYFNATTNLNGKVWGLGINFPHTVKEKEYYSKKDSEYQFLDFYIDSYWDEFLIEFWKYL